MGIVTGGGAVPAVKEAVTVPPMNVQVVPEGALESIVVTVPDSAWLPSLPGAASATIPPPASPLEGEPESIGAPAPGFVLLELHAVDSATAIDPKASQRPAMISSRCAVGVDR
jgi:hypothetical protein